MNTAPVIVETAHNIDENIDETQKSQNSDRSRGWVFTLNMKEEWTDEGDLINLLNVSGADTWVFQLECGKEGTYHYQGQAYWKNAVSFHVVRQLGLGHIEPMKNCKASIKYCTKKDDTFVAGPWSKGIPINFTDTRKKMELRPFQQTLWDLVQTDRQITWVADKAGNMGKTTFAKHWAINNKKFIFVNGKGADIRSAIATMVWKGNAPEVVIFGYPRSKEAYVSYEAIEEVKDGLFFSTKYESGMVVFPSPKVIVLANFEPDYKQMTADRWDVREINDKYELIECHRY